MDCPSAYYLANANFSSVFANTDQTKEGNASKRPRRSFEILTAGYKKSEIQGPHLESNQDSPVPFFHNNDGIYYNGINPSLHHAYQAKASLTLRLTSAWRTLLSSNPLGFSTLQLVHKIRNVSYAFDAFPQLISILPDSRGYIVIAHATSSNIPGFVLPFFKYRTHVQLTGSDHVLFRERVIIHEHDFTQVLRVDLALDSPQIPNGHIVSRVTKVTAAIKRFRPRSQHERAEVLRVFEQERDNLLAISKWNHERIMELLGSFEVTDDNHGHLNLIFPYAEGGDLHNFMRLREAPEWLSEISKDKHGQDWFIYKEIIGLANAMAYVHRKDASGFVLHRDIKPANILIHKNQFKLADFGTARLKGGEETSKTDWDRGTKMYAAPERLLLDRHGRARDVWAFGCVILELMVLIAYGWTAAEQEDAMVDVFKEERRASNDEPNTTAFSHSMDCVNRWMTKMEKEDDTDGFIVKGTLLTVRDMLNIDPEQRPKSSTVAERLEDLE
ncbi:MAG: hypothetical protein M1827_004554 [Pycnora praestabilis]|nr:MAG: hypothetical protein M1827_004554 [Pycnora praestabilis]